MKLKPVATQNYPFEKICCDVCGKTVRRIEAEPLPGETPWVVDINAKPYTRTYCPNCIPKN